MFCWILPLGLYNKLEMVHCIYQGVTDYTCSNNIAFLSLKIILANSVDPDEMLPYAAFHFGLHCLPKYAFICLFYSLCLSQQFFSHVRMGLPELNKY